VARPASTLVLVRDRPVPGPDAAAAELEVLLVRRNDRADFVGGAHVFPGGGVDGLDGSSEAVALSHGRTDEDASALLGLPGGGLAYWVAALRECFEEAGILLAFRRSAVAAGGSGPGTVLSLADPAEERRFHLLRADVNDGRRSFVAMCRDEGLVLALGGVHYFAHWITPESSPRRYDTRFFVAAAPAGQVPMRDEREIVEEIWIRPADALARHRAGEIDLVLPTVRTLQAVGTFDRASTLLDTVARASATTTGATPMISEGHGLRIAFPGDPGSPR
jgi:8-oxo-dGTP pyrophosphatase MutT (NUDIX family)